MTRSSVRLVVHGEVGSTHPTGGDGRGAAGEGEDVAGHVGDVDLVVVGGGGGQDVAGAELVLPGDLAGFGVEGGEGAVDVADEDVAGGVGEGGVVDVGAGLV